MLNKHIQATAKSKHAGQSGIIVADYGNYLMVTADDQKYSGAHKNSSFDTKVFQIDKRAYKELK